jgi:uncharacterized membrane protein
MKSIQHQIKINWPVEALFNYVSDLSNNPSWQRQVVNAEWVSADRNTSGARFVETRNVLGREQAATVQLKEFEQFRKRSLSVMSGSLKTDLIMEFEPQGEDTVMKLTISCQPRGVYRLAEDLLLRHALREGYENLHRLKMLLENSN